MPIEFFQPTLVNIGDQRNISPSPDYSSEPFISGYEIVLGPSSVWRQGGTKFSIKPGSARAYNCGFNIVFNPFGISNTAPVLEVDISNLGALGCYPTPYAELDLAPTDNTFGVYILGDTSGVNPTTAVVATGNNFLLPGYNVWRRIGAILIDGTYLQLIQYTQTGSSVDREYVTLQYFTGSGYGPTEFFEIPFIRHSTESPFATEVLISRQFRASALTDYASLTQFNYGDTSKAPYIIKNPVVTGEDTPYVQDQVWLQFGKNEDGKNALYVSVIGDSSFLDIFICGWRESLGLQAI